MRRVIVHLLSWTVLILARSTALWAFSFTRTSGNFLRCLSKNDSGIGVSSRRRQPLKYAAPYSSSDSSGSRKSVSSIASTAFVQEERIPGPARPEPAEDDGSTVSHARRQTVATVALVATDWLKEHERVVSEERVRDLHDATVAWGAYRLPLVVDARSGAILDGHHRYAVGRRMGLSRLPAVLVDYLHDDSITVDVWPGCGRDDLTKEEVVEMSLSDGVYPPKTSRHGFLGTAAAAAACINVPLAELK